MTVGHLRPAAQLRTATLATVARLLDRPDRALLIADHPFLAEYAAELTRAGLDGRAWDRVVLGAADAPLARLARAGIDPLALKLLLTLGLVEEDPRFVSAIDPGGTRPTVGGLVALWRGDNGDDRPDHVRRALGDLAGYCMIAAVDPAQPRGDRALVIAPALWDTLGGEYHASDAARLVTTDALPGLDDYIAGDAVIARTRALVTLLARDPAQIVCLRGPRGNGRRTLAAAVARALGRPLLEVEPRLLADSPGWRLAGAIAAASGAALLVRVAPGPGETVEVPRPPFPVPMFVIAGATGGIRCAVSGAISEIALPLPDRASRGRHWARVAPREPAASVAGLATAFRWTSGTIARAGAAALAQTALDGTSALTVTGVRAAARGLGDARLEAVATRVGGAGEPEFLALDDAARSEFAALALRCRHREALAAHAGALAGEGVRALFAGPSGTGKTLAARRLAYDLGHDLWRIDLAATVSKYIGETEKGLDRAFAAAEEMDAVLLLDEGDALMTRRTDVGNANDRYANLETNYLLQRIEGFGGILIVTTNAADRIDKAFARRMDVVVGFRLPDAHGRYQILERHLAPHRVGDALLQEIAVRCPLSGGQIRNIALHARLLALDAGAPLGDAELLAALAREYRKMDAHSPLKPMLAAVR